MPFLNDIMIRRSRSYVPYVPPIIGQISAGRLFGLFTTGSSSWSWGNNQSGQLGDNTITSRRTPVSILGVTKTFCRISAGRDHSMAIDKNGRVWGWGINSAGNLGDGTITQRQTPVSIAGAVKTFCKISAGRSGWTTSIDKNGRVWSWGASVFGTLGDNSLISKRTPVSLGGIGKTFCEITTGTSHTMAIDKNGKAWGWGNNDYGQLGDNTVVQRLTPVSILGVNKTFCKITATILSTHAIDKNGRVWSWGGNNFGNLGANLPSGNDRYTPVSIAGTVKTFCKISAGFDHVMALDKNGSVWSWGSNLVGQLGDNTLNDKCTPVSLGGTSKIFCDISAGDRHSFAIDKNGDVWSWGLNGFGALGDNSLTSRLTPVRVCKL